MKQTFKKAEKLKSKKLIDQLFLQGNTSFLFPFKLVWYFPEIEFEVRSKVLVGVSKKNLKKATDRNKVKRRMREAFRRNKSILNDSLESTNRYCTLGFLFVGKEISTFKETETKIIALLHRLIEDNEKNSG